jgi:hypothetical protein
MSLTKKQIKEYIDGGGLTCPVCKGTSIEGDFVEINTGCADQKVYCTDCGATWLDCYTLTEIQDFDPGESV